MTVAKLFQILIEERMKKEEATKLFNHELHYKINELESGQGTLASKILGFESLNVYLRGITIGAKDGMLQKINSELNNRPR